MDSDPNKELLPNLSAYVSMIREYADSFIGLSMDDVRTRLGDAELKQSKWASGDFGGPQLIARYPGYEFSVLFYDDKAVTTSFQISTS